MDKYPKRRVFQQQGIKTLMEAANDSPKLAGVIARGKAIPIILSALKKYPFDRMIQLRGLRTLCNLSDREANAEALVLNHGGAPIVMDTMSEFSKDTNMVVAGCILLAKLGHFEQLRRPLVDAKAIKILAAAFVDHEGDDDVQEAARKAMKLLL